MPLPIWLAHRLIRRVTEARVSGRLPFLRPDAKSQVTVRYGDDGRAVVDTVVLSTQHDAGIDLPSLREAVRDEVILPVIGEELRSPAFRTLINPAGAFVDRRAEGRHRSHRTQDHRRHLRRGLPARRRSVLGQGCDQGRSLWRLCGPLARQARRGGRHIARAAPCSLPMRSAWPNRCRWRSTCTGIPGSTPRRLARALTATFDLTPAGIIRELALDRPDLLPDSGFRTLRP